MYTQKDYIQLDNSFLARTVFVLIATLSTLGGQAQRIVGSAPARVSVGENFRVTYTIDTQDVEEFRSAIRTNDVAELIAGPYTSQQSSFQMVNGHTSSSSSITYTYTLNASKNGTYVIPPAKAKIGNKVISSQTLKIVVSGKAKKNNGGAAQMHDDTNDINGIQTQRAGENITGRDLFFKVSASKKKVYEQEPILLTYKVYTRINLETLKATMPDVNGFHLQEIPGAQNGVGAVERVNGIPYKTAIWNRYILFPQVTGKIKIPNVTYEGTVVQTKDVDPWEAIFNGGSDYVSVPCKIVAPGLDINVTPLPTKPQNFSGGVGHFSLKTSMDKTSVKAGEPITVRVEISGTGNMKLIKLPKLNLPADFEQYDPKVTDKTKVTINGVEGSMVYNVIIVPRNIGYFTLSPISFCYFDTKTETYKTLTSQNFRVNVTKGDGTSMSSGTSFEDNLDIHPIMAGEPNLKPLNETFFGGIAYILWLLLPLGTFAGVLIVFRRRAALNSDMVKLRGQKANKVAVKRLQKARKLLNEGQQEAFYDEVMHALLGYAADKMAIATELLSRENIAEKLSQYGVDNNTVSKFVAALEECEFERFAPGAPSGNMEKTYNYAMTAIIDIEQVMRMRTRRRNGATLSLILFLLFLSTSTFGAGQAATQPLSSLYKIKADSAYKKGDYGKAIDIYKRLLKQGEDASVFYNLGNAYYRAEELGKAILAYERALKLEPGNRDIRFNLEFVRSQITDKPAEESEMFFVVWYHNLVNFTSVDSWAIISIVAFICALLFIAVYLFGSNIWIRKVGFSIASITTILFVWSFHSALVQKLQLTRHETAIVMGTVGVRKTPVTTTSSVFTLHEGTKVTITDKSVAGWREVILSDGRSGWISSSAIEEI